MLKAEHDKLVQRGQVVSVRGILCVPVIVDVCQEDVVCLVASYVAGLLRTQQIRTLTPTLKLSQSFLGKG